MLKHKRRRIQMCDVEYAHEQILATANTQDIGLETSRETGRETGSDPGTGANVQVSATRDSNTPAAGLASATTPI
jgi:hypothetical protein